MGDSWKKVRKTSVDKVINKNKDNKKNKKTKIIINKENKNETNKVNSCWKVGGIIVITVEILGFFVGFVSSS